MGVPEHRDLGEARRVIRAQRLGRRFGRRPVFAGIDLELERGDFLLVSGPNGSGKTTLLRLLAGLLAPTDGTLEVAADRGRIGFLGHEPLLYRELTALENLDLYGRLYHVRERRERIGMLQRLALCRTFLHSPDLLLLDEPFSALDAEGAELLDAELAGHAARTVVVATHQPERVAAHATDRLALA